MTLYNRTVKNHKIFPAAAGEYAAWYAAIAWLKQSGYCSGKLDYPGPTAFVAGNYYKPHDQSIRRRRSTICSAMATRAQEKGRRKILPISPE